MLGGRADQAGHPVPEVRRIVDLSRHLGAQLLDLLVCLRTIARTRSFFVPKW
jgi:hypothetical protein